MFLLLKYDETRYKMKKKCVKFETKKNHGANSIPGAKKKLGRECRKLSYRALSARHVFISSALLPIAHMPTVIEITRVYRKSARDDETI